MTDTLLTPRPPRRRPPRAAALAALLAAVALLVAACGDGGGGAPAADGLRVAVTMSVLGAVVEDLVGDGAAVEVVIPDGVDPHDYSASAQDVSSLASADLVIENGLLIEEGLQGALDEARRAGVSVLTATDHAPIRDIGEGELPGSGHGHSDDEEHAHREDEVHGHSEDEEHAHRDDEVHGHAGEGEPGHAHGPEDPHIWMDPATMAIVVRGLAPEIAEALGLDLAERAEEVAGRLEALTEEVRAELAGIPAERRRLVTGHDSMGYFADRFGFEVVGTIIPGLSTQAEVSAGDLARLRAQMEGEGVTTVFTETGTPAAVAEGIARESGGRVVEVTTHGLPDGGGYAEFIRAVAGAVRDGLS